MIKQKKIMNIVKYNNVKHVNVSWSQ